MLSVSEDAKQMEAVRRTKGRMGHTTRNETKQTTKMVSQPTVKEELINWMREVGEWRVRVKGCVSERARAEWEVGMHFGVK